MLSGEKEWVEGGSKGRVHLLRKRKKEGVGSLERKTRLPAIQGRVDDGLTGKG